MMSKPHTARPLNRLPALIIAASLLAAAVVAGPIADDVRKVETLYRAGKYEDARDRGLALLSNRMKDMPQKKAALCAHFVNKSCGKLDPPDIDSALLAFSKFIARESLVIDQTTSDVVSGGVWMYLKAKRYEEGIAIADRALGMEWTYKEGRIKTLVPKAMCLDRLKRYGDAADAFVQVGAEAGESYKLNYSNTCCAIRCLMQSVRKDHEWVKAAERWSRLVAAWDGSFPESQANALLAITKPLHTSIVPNIKDAAAATRLATQASRAIPRCVRTPRRCHELQKAIAAFWVCSGDKAATGRALKTLYDTCPAESFKEAVDFIADAFKRTDGSLVRANRFLDYVNFGTVGPDGKAGTADDTVSPFPEGPAKLSPEAAATYEEIAAAYQEALAEQRQEGWEEKRALANLHRYMGDPTKALALLAESFALAPMQPGPLRAVSGDMANVLIQLTGNPADGDRLDQFLKLGADGPDGKAGTDDDLDDPRKPFLK